MCRLLSAYYRDGGLLVGAISGFTVSGERSGSRIGDCGGRTGADYGIGMLGPVLLLAGLIQCWQGFKLGQVFRAMSPAVIYGMLAGIGVLILHPSFTS